MKWPMAPTTHSWWRLALRLTSVLSCVHAAIQDNQSLSAEHWRFDARTLRSTLPGTTYDAAKRAPPRRHVRSLRSPLDNASVPQFMKDFYERYAQNSVLQPTYDVIRSFYPQRAEFFEDFHESPGWVLTFRLAPLKMERVKLAELRIFFAQKDFVSKSEAVIVTLLEMKRDKKTGRVRRRKLIRTVKMEGATEKAGILRGKWLTLNVTRLARRAFRRRSNDLELAIKTSSLQFSPNILTEADETSPVLVVYSDEVLTSTFTQGTSWRRWRRRLTRNQTETTNTAPYNPSISDPNYDFTGAENLTSVVFEQSPIASHNTARSRSPRSTNKRRRAKTGPKQRRRRRGCRRKAMYVRFEDINWHNQIIAPRGYQAFRCVGKCFFPLSDRLSPTKHAIIQTLLHTNRPDSVSRPCCVPTALDPIPILYIDENGVVTYKYRFEGMVASQCGCR